MITDQQYKAAIDRIEQLEKRMNSLSRALAEMTLKSNLISPVLMADKVDENRKDITRYMYRGVLYCKRNLVLAIVKDYVKERNISSSDLIYDAFPESLQGSLGVVRSVNEAEKYNNSASRYFFGDEDAIVLEDGVYVVCKEWTCKNIRRFISAADNLGYKVDIINRN